MDIPLSSTIIKARCFFPSKAEGFHTHVDEELLLGAVGTVTGDVDHPQFGIYVSLVYLEFDDRHILGRNLGLWECLEEMMVCGRKLRLFDC